MCASARTVNGSEQLSSGPLHALSHWGGKKIFKKGQLQGRLKQLNLEQDPGYNTR